jgi:hypothetical protein
MEKHPKSKPKTNKKPTDDEKVNHSDSDDNDTTLSIDPDEPLVSDIAHNLFKLACKQAREERQQVKLRQQNKKTPTMLKKKKKLTINDIDRLFEEKRLRPSTIKNDLNELYQKSTDRVRSMLDRNQIEQFIKTKQKRL